MPAPFNVVELNPPSVTSNTVLTMNADLLRDWLMARNLNQPSTDVVAAGYQSEWFGVGGFPTQYDVANGDGSVVDAGSVDAWPATAIDAAIPDVATALALEATANLYSYYNVYGNMGNLPAFPIFDVPQSIAAINFQHATVDKFFDYYYGNETLNPDTRYNRWAQVAPLNYYYPGGPNEYTPAGVQVEAIGSLNYFMLDVGTVGNYVVDNVYLTLSAFDTSVLGNWSITTNGQWMASMVGGNVVLDPLTNMVQNPGIEPVNGIDYGLIGVPFAAGLGNAGTISMYHFFDSLNYTTIQQQVIYLTSVNQEVDPETGTLQTPFATGVLLNYGTTGVPVAGQIGQGGNVDGFYVAAGYAPSWAIMGGVTTLDDALNAFQSYQNGDVGNKFGYSPYGVQYVANEFGEVNTSGQFHPSLFLSTGQVNKHTAQDILTDYDPTTYLNLDLSVDGFMINVNTGVLGFTQGSVIHPDDMLSAYCNNWNLYGNNGQIIFAWDGMNALQQSWNAFVNAQTPGCIPYINEPIDPYTYGVTLPKYIGGVLDPTTWFVPNQETINMYNNNGDQLDGIRTGVVYDLNMLIGSVLISPTPETDLIGLADTTDDTPMGTIARTKLAAEFVARLKQNVLRDTLGAATQGVGQAIGTLTSALGDAVAGAPNPFGNLGNRVLDNLIDPFKNYDITVAKGGITRAANFITSVTGTRTEPENPIKDPIRWTDYTDPDTVDSDELEERSAFGTFLFGENLKNGDPSDILLAYTSKGQQGLLVNNLSFNQKYFPSYNYFTNADGQYFSNVKLQQKKERLQAKLERMRNRKTKTDAEISELETRIEQTDALQYNNVGNPDLFNWYAEEKKQLENQKLQREGLSQRLAERVAKIEAKLAGLPQKMVYDDSPTPDSEIDTSPKDANVGGFRNVAEALRVTDANVYPNNVDFGQVAGTGLLNNSAGEPGNESTDNYPYPVDDFRNTNRYLRNPAAGASQFDNIGPDGRPIKKPIGPGNEPVLNPYTRVSDLVKHGVGPNSDDSTDLRGLNVAYKIVDGHVESVDTRIGYNIYPTEGDPNFQVGLNRKEINQGNSKFSVLESNGFVKITPYKDDFELAKKLLKDAQPNSDQDYEDLTNTVHKYMFSLENLAWKDFTNELPWWERGPNGGRIMWFPPYDIQITDTSTVTWGQENFIGRSEPVFAYNHSDRGGTLGFKVVVDNPGFTRFQPAVRTEKLETMNTYAAYAVEQEACYPVGPPERQTPVTLDFAAFIGLGFYFDNDVPPLGSDPTLAGSPFDTYWASYTSFATFTNYQNNASTSDGTTADSSNMYEFMITSVFQNYNEIQVNFLPDLMAQIQGGGVVTVKFKGSASSPGSATYNQNLSKRRLDSIKKWFANQTVDGTSFGPFVTSGQLKIEYDAVGEFETNVSTKPVPTGAIPSPTTFGPFDCTQNLPTNGYDGTVNTTPKIYSVQAAACRCVRIASVEVIPPAQPTVQDQTSPFVADLRAWFEQNATNLPASPTKSYRMQFIDTNNVAVDLDLISALPFYDGEGNDVYGPNLHAFLFGETASATGYKYQTINADNPSETFTVAAYLADYLGVAFNETLDCAIQEQFYKVTGTKTMTTVYNNQGQIVPSSDAAGPTTTTSPYQQTANGRPMGMMVEDAQGINVNNVDLSSDRSSTLEWGLHENRSPNNELNEYIYFQRLKQSDSILFEKFKEHLNFFDPAFHSTTPVGFNNRLNFLKQCTRQGPSLNNARDTDSLNFVSADSNLSFGRPPVVVLRLGDFYHTRIIIESVDIQYEPLIWDMNPEGIGVQPMIANINLSFKYIGGSSMSGPITRLQTAITNNFFANTELYVNRRVDRAVNRFKRRPDAMAPFYKKDGDITSNNPEVDTYVPTGAEVAPAPDTTEPTTPQEVTTQQGGTKKTKTNVAGNTKPACKFGFHVKITDYNNETRRYCVESRTAKLVDPTLKTPYTDMVAGIPDITELFRGLNFYKPCPNSSPNGANEYTWRFLSIVNFEAVMKTSLKNSFGVVNTQNLGTSCLPGGVRCNCPNTDNTGAGNYTVVGTNAVGGG